MDAMFSSHSQCTFYLPYTIIITCHPQIYVSVFLKLFENIVEKSEKNWVPVFFNRPGASVKK